MSSDFDLCDQTFVRLEEVGEEPKDELYQTIVLSWSAHGVIGNGGFECLYEGAFHERDPGYGGTLAAYERLGAEACASAFREALAWLGTPPPSHGLARMERLEAVPRDERDRVAAAFWAGQQELERQLASYIRAHQGELEGRDSRYRGRLGDLRIRKPGTLELLSSERVVRSFELHEWQVDFEVERAWHHAAAFALVAASFAALGALYGSLWVIAAVGAAVLAAKALRSRVKLALQRDGERVRLGGWNGLDGTVFSFISTVMSLARREPAEE